MKHLTNPDIRQDASKATTDAPQITRLGKAPTTDRIPFGRITRRQQHDPGEAGVTDEPDVHRGREPVSPWDILTIHRLHAGLAAIRGVIVRSINLSSWIVKNLQERGAHGIHDSQRQER